MSRHVRPPTRRAHVVGMIAAVTTVDLSATTASDVAVRLVPERVAHRHTILPLVEDNRHLTFATAQPFDERGRA